MRILAVDDDESILTLLDRILSGSGRSDVVTVASGTEALERISQSEEPFDCVLVDIQMPELDGIALTRMIRVTPGYRHVAILMLTAAQEKHYLDAAFAAGATDYVTKPFDFVDLRRRINEAKDTCRRKRDLQHSALMAGELKKMGGEPKDVRLEQIVPLADIDVAIDDREFENYLVEMTRIRKHQMSVVAAKIHGVGEFYLASTSDAFLALVGEVSTAINETLVAGNGLMSYRGAGLFLCVKEGRPQASSRDLEARANAHLRELCASAACEDVRILVGDAVPLALSSELDAIASLSEAVAEVEDRGLALSGMGDIPKRLLGRRYLGAEQDRLDKRAFSRLLNDTLPNVENDAWSEKLKQRARR